MSAVRRNAGGFGLLATVAAAVALAPTLSGYGLGVAITALVFVTLAVAFDLVVGRVGALSLAQPVFFGFGAYAAALLAMHVPLGFWGELAVVLVGAVVVALAIGIPSFRLSLHSFAIGTLGFALIMQSIAQNWIPVTGGPLCKTAIPPMEIPYVFGTFTPVTRLDQFYVILVIATIVCAGVALLGRSRLGTAFIAVRDDPVLAAGRGLWPTQLRLTAFALSAMASAVAGAFFAHYQTVVCPTELDFSYTALLLAMVFIGGRASLRGVITAAIAISVLPELLRVADAWRLVIFGAILLVAVQVMPDGVERVYAAADRMGARVLRRARRASAAGDAK